MHELFDSTRQTYLTLDDQHRVRELSHRPRPVKISAPTLQLAAMYYLHEHLDVLQIQPDELVNLGLPAEPLPIDAKSEYRLADEKTFFDITTIEYQQTYFGLPIWNAGIAVHLKHEPKRVIATTFSGRGEIEIDRPDPKVVRQFSKLTRKDLLGILKLKTNEEKGIDLQAIELNRSRLMIYRYEAAHRLPPVEVVPRDEHEQPDPTKGPGAVASHIYPTLPIAEIDDSIKEGRHYVVAEIHFTLAVMPIGTLNWRMYVEVGQGEILYLRALVDNVDGMIYTTDVVRQGGTVGTGSNNATLNPFRSSVTLQGLNPPEAGVQSLSGTFVQVSDHEAPSVVPPTQSAGSDFNYNTRTNHFAAVNCYHHVDAFFRLVQDLGFNVSNYFDGTTFPVSVDHRGRFGTIDGIEINASCGGNTVGNGIGLPDFELNDLSDTTNPLGMAVHWGVVLHEFGGHGILWDHVNSANFGFAHSAGDSFGAILNDPGSLAPDRFVTFPWTIITRRHDRTPAAGWGWSGTNDVGGYSSEQILCTSNFRIYRSIGGDSTRLQTQQFAARYMAYLILRAVATLTPSTNPSNATLFASAMQTADLADWTSEGHAGGAYGKVIRWAFEKQGMYQPTGAPTPVTTAGAPPAVDVYIEDGRGGEYPYLANHWSCQNIWNRRSADGGTAHERPLVSVPNYAYVKIKNRGTQVATNVIVKGFHCNPGTGLTWPNDWQAMTTAQLPAANVPANNAGEIIVGPFEWTPSQPDHECMLMIVSATGDPSNIDNFTAGDTIPEWRLVPHDNNIGQRNVSPEAGGGGARGLAEGFPKRFMLRNPFRIAAGFELEPKLPDFLSDRGYELIFDNPGGRVFSLAPGQSREIVLRLKTGVDFSATDVANAGDPSIYIETYGNGILVGGMTYQIDPNLVSGRPDDKPGTPSGYECVDRCQREAAKLLNCLDLPRHKVKSARVRKITIDIEIDDDPGCC